MVTDRGDGTDRALDALLSEAGAERPGPDLVARVLADAARVQAEAATPAPRRRGLFREPPGLVAALGGWGGLSGVTAAGLVGLAVGFWSPGALDTLGGGLWPVAAEGGAWMPDLAELALEVDDV
ncbi:hypothetical protein [Roseicyclus sp.]|uniref:hypothetical protein n=1 Tax=Roseicyclus sp. TaxID=1914329 RepID=UPI003F9FCCC1